MLLYADPGAVAADAETAGVADAVVGGPDALMGEAIIAETIADSAVAAVLPPEAAAVAVGAAAGANAAAPLPVALPAKGGLLSPIGGRRIVIAAMKGSSGGTLPPPLVAPLPEPICALTTSAACPVTLCRSSAISLGEKRELIPLCSQRIVESAAAAAAASLVDAVTPPVLAIAVLWAADVASATVVGGLAAAATDAAAAPGTPAADSSAPP